ncbi:MAG: ABC transporter permease [Phycisphaerae bacterium]
MKVFSIETIMLGLNNLRLHKLRSLLTSLGIIFGVAAVICMLSITEAASEDEMRIIELLGTRNIIVNSVKPQSSQNSGQGNTNLVEYGITNDDIDRLASTVPHIEHLVPLKTVGYRARQGEYKADFQTAGTTPAFFSVVNVKIARGRVFGEPDLQNGKNVCVIGADVRDELFKFKDPLGETILVERHPNAVPFTIIGILEKVTVAGAPERGVAERNLNREIFVPFTTALAQFGEITMRRSAGSREMRKVQLSGMYVNVDNEDNVLAVSEMTKRVFAHGHEDLDYEILVPLERLELAKRKKRNNQYTLGFIAGISLLVGGIGIMNIMLATVTERTREIGIRRALGARQRHIVVQFLTETVVLSTTGGVLGTALGVFGAYMITYLAEWETIVKTWSILISFGLSVLIGIFFGMYPAVSAAKLDPIDALRYE